MNWIYESPPITLPACPQCGRTFAYARVLTTRAIILYCAAQPGAAADHARKWYGRTAIANGEFVEGGAFYGAVPAGYLGQDPVGASLDIPTGVKKRVLATQTKCVDCGIAPCSAETAKNDRLLGQWLRENRPDIYESIVECGNKFRLGLKLSSWRLEVAKVNNDLITAARFATQSSQLKADHGIPKKFLRQNFAVIPWQQRLFATSQLVFARCEKCNLAKSSKMPEREHITELYIRHYHNNNTAVARADVMMWQLLESTLETVYGPISGVA